MKGFKFALLALLCFFQLNDPVSAQEKKKIVIGVGNFEPFFYEKDQSGIFMDLIKEIFQELPEYDIEFRFMSNYRLLKELNAGRIDAAANIFKNVEIKGHLSVPVFKFTDVVSTLKSRNLKVSSVADLGGKSIATYQGAKDFLGQEFKAVADKNQKYLESSDQSQSAKLLTEKEVDAAVGDINIFLHSVQVHFKDKIKGDHYDFHYIFPVLYSHMGINDKTLLEKFNKAFEKVKTEGRDEAIYKKYQEKMGYIKL